MDGAFAFLPRLTTLHRNLTRKLEMTMSQLNAVHETPLLSAWNAPFGVPPLDAIEPGHFQPAFARALAEHSAEIATIAADSAAPDFENTVAALERSGKLLARVTNVFYVLAGAHT